MQVLKFADGTAVGRCDGVFNGRPVANPKDLRILRVAVWHDPRAGSHAEGVSDLIQRTLGEL